MHSVSKYVAKFFQFLAIMNNAEYPCTILCVDIMFSNLLGTYLWVALLGHIVTVPLFEELPTCFPNSYQQCVRVLISLHPCQQFLLSFWLLQSQWVWRHKSNCSFDLPSPNSIEHLFMCCWGIFFIGLFSLSQKILALFSSWQWHLLFLSVWDLPRSWWDKSFLLKPGHSEFYVMRTLYLKTYWQCSGRRKWGWGYLLLYW